MASKSFYDWLIKQENQRTPIGQFARTVARDPAFPKDVAIPLDTVLDFVRGLPGASPQTVAVARTAYRAFARG